MQIHAWQGSHLVHLSEFHDKRHFIEFYLNFKVPYPKEYDGGRNHNHSNLSSSIPQGPNNIKEVQEKQAMVRNFMNNANDMLPSFV